MGTKNLTRKEEERLFEKEYKLFGKYDEESNAKIKAFMKSIGYKLPEIRIKENIKGVSMSHRENERKRQVANRNEIFRDGGKGVFKKIERDFVLSNPLLNLWDGIREDALHYFKANNIQWWESGKTPSGHLLSSQIACINHLYFIRQREELATAILKGIYPEIEKALKLKSGFVEFEVTGNTPLGLERTTKRGANCTSQDAMMLGITKKGKRILFSIEWKYTESYNIEDLSVGRSGATRIKAYDALINKPDCPIDKKYYNDLFYEPFYQMMRQTLLAKQMVDDKWNEADDWMHIDVIPTKNKELREKITSPALTSLGSSVEEVWKMILAKPEKYLVIDPDEFLRPIVGFEDIKSIAGYLSKRYQ